MMLPDWLEALEQRNGRVERSSDRVRLLRTSAVDGEYSNAQVSDKAATPGWRPPLTLTVRARFSHPADQLRGTAGFGFWNAALTPGARGFRAPRAAWFFFGGPPHDVHLALGVPGRGFKAAVLDADRPPFYALLPAAPLGFLLMRVPTLYRRLWPFAQWAIGADEAMIAPEGATTPQAKGYRVDITDWHSYELRWEIRRATFTVDGRTVLTTPRSPKGPLGFVAWIDNSYAIATPRGRFGLGLVAEPEPQWLELAEFYLGTPPGVPLEEVT